MCAPSLRFEIYETAASLWIGTWPAVYEALAPANVYIILFIYAFDQKQK